MLLPHGMARHPLEGHQDERGVFTEIFRESWNLGSRALQWNLVRSDRDVVRGIHVHLKHLDYWFLVDGQAAVGWKDLRKHSPTYELSGVIDLPVGGKELLVIPPGVAHGFQFRSPSIHLYGVSHYWDKEDELGCRWDDPKLGIPWPSSLGILSERDEGAKRLADLVKELKPHQGGLFAPVRNPC